MPDYIVMTDSSCDLPAEVAEQFEIPALPLSTQIEGKTYRNYIDGSGVDIQWFYARLRENSPPPPPQSICRTLPPQWSQSCNPAAISFTWVFLLH